MNELLTLSEVQAILRIDRSQAYALVKEPCFPTVCIGNRIRVSRAALEKWIGTQGKEIN